LDLAQSVNGFNYGVMGASLGNFMWRHFIYFALFGWGDMGEVPTERANQEKPAMGDCHVYIDGCMDLAKEVFWALDGIKIIKNR
jgi:hypothetical protein